MERVDAGEAQVLVDWGGDVAETDTEREDERQMRYWRAKTRETGVQGDMQTVTRQS